MDAEEAYAQCEQITWEQARNFAYGIRLLPPDKRRALAAVYAYARRIDDIGDGDLPAGEKTTQLEAARQQVRTLVAKVKGDTSAVLDDSDPVLVALTDVGARSFVPGVRGASPASQHVPLEAFEELIDGCLADVNQARYDTFDDLLWYCRCVAGSVGRLSLGIYGTTHPEVQNKLADDLGVALQLTNILRDVREDFLNDRVYLPREDLDKFGIEFAPFGSPEPFPSETMQARFANLVEFEANRAREWYGSGLRLLATIDRRSAACTGAMAGIYRRLLERIARNPHAVLEGRMSLPGGEKALVAAQALAGLDRWKYRKGAQPGGAQPRGARPKEVQR
ncbi:MAG TPA: squalene/phytoene synthase family protein [Trebonia sp.]|nr:squalene/phytoene synthase family protein [Trebonia sp.]